MLTAQLVTPPPNALSHEGAFPGKSGHDRTEALAVTALITPAQPTTTRASNPIRKLHF